MSESVWTPYLTSRDKEVLRASGYGARMGFGQRPALIIVDVSYNFAGEHPEPILESIRRWRNSCGEEAWAAISVIHRLADVCRGKGLPIFYSTNTRRPDGFDAGSWRWKNSRELDDNEQDIRGNEIVAEIAPQPQDVVIYKTKPSAFFGTPLLSFLMDLKVDSLLVCGVSTSGCVRASCVDAISYGFRPMVVREAVGDRHADIQESNLYDMNAKYADVISEAEAAAYLKQQVPVKQFAAR